ncbi:imidazole glycerol phosphate synthase subunit HisH [Luteimonas fraxinea]|uniref:Imidazole glycerol phosphate synthase subunit HisH n=1 Tax=Luteimonas fraxinea TaxID=2901869 RepID=A0ABS8UBS5_9GAMM|nr:imidazole glycerol phosphate synthase subunit HisH [Luteimonas fraxinea]MCD9096943.1 imidazole glycerol phosphate synthase subunit HisH [Luteimonas fraxinea]UHH09715.1 imidazole glycerol phosphate synthase subunit HisH [Luteimonas fraxinea]
MRVVIVDAGGANTGSVRYAFERLDIDAALVTDADSIRAADRVILPGVGTAAQVMARLQQLDLVDVLRTLDRPLLGICVGMQLLFDASEEGEVAGLGLLPGRVSRLRGGPGLRVPHMGWSTLHATRPDALVEGVDGAQAYFVHSFAAPVTDDCVLVGDHGQAFAAAVRRGHIAGTQFHPERSAAVGARVLRNFLSPAFEA